MEKTIFITGSSSGLGKATAILFAQKGWKVIATMRNPDADKELGKIANIAVLPLDVTNPAQIDETISKLLKETGIDIVFNNAGYGFGGPFEGADDAQILQQVNTNLMGVMRVTKAFIPHFREKKSGMFINTTSIGGHVAFPFFSVYHATKWALEGWSESLSYELAQFEIIVKTIAPGGISTDFSGRSLVLSNHDAYKTIMEKAVATFRDPKRLSTYSTPQQIAEIVYKAATDGKTKLRYVAGKDAKSLYKTRHWLGYRFFMKQVNNAFFK